METHNRQFAMSVPEAAHALRISSSLMYELVAAKIIKASSITGRLLVPADYLRQLAEADAGVGASDEILSTLEVIRQKREEHLARKRQMTRRRSASVSA